MAISESELAAIEAIIRGRPNGVGISDLVGMGATEAQRRAMHRRLKKLLDQGRIRSAGSDKLKRYYLADQSARPILIHKDEARTDAEPSLFVHLSKTGQNLQKIIRRPEKERAAVGYKREFLSGYQPNVTFYLSPRERKHLAEMGAAEAGGSTPAGTYARKILDRLLIDLSWNSSRLEGNTYSILDTHVLLEQGKAAEGKSAQETQMIVNHKDAIEFLVDAADEVGFNRHTILNLHSMLSNNLLDPQASGRLREGIIGIGKSVYSPLQTPAIIEECFNELLSKAEAITDPFEQSFFVTIQLPYLQPFLDVNKRVARLAANIPFIKHNLSPISFVDVADDTYIEAMLSVYELNKTELARDMYVWAYERSARRYAALRQSAGAPDPFRLKYKEELRAIVAGIILDKLGKPAAAKHIKDFVTRAIPSDDRARFTEAAQTELLGLHEGNFARYRVKPSQFFAWKAAWEDA